MRNGVRSGYGNFAILWDMARPLRVEYPGALYHVISRGNAQQPIFLTDHDRYNFLRNLKACIELHNLICHAYCLMDNHYHLLIETPDGNLSKGMRDINGNYTQAFNATNRRVGHVLQGRYKAFVIEKEHYLLEVSRYIVNNPVKAKMVDQAHEYRWSSYRATSGHRAKPSWLETDFTLSFFSKEKQAAQKQFRRFVKEGIDNESPYNELQHGFILGSPQFVSYLWEKTVGSEEMKEIPRHQRFVGRPTLFEIFEDVQTVEQRNDAIVFARFRCGYLTTEIANQLGIDRSTIGKICNQTKV